MITKKDKELIITALKMVDVKKLEIDQDDLRLKKWFRFGSYNGLMIASEIVKNLPETKPRKIKVS